MLSLLLLVLVLLIAAASQPVGESKAFDYLYLNKHIVSTSNNILLLIEQLSPLKLAQGSFKYVMTLTSHFKWSLAAHL